METPELVRLLALMTEELRVSQRKVAVYEDMYTDLPVMARDVVEDPEYLQFNHNRFTETKDDITDFVNKRKLTVRYLPDPIPLPTGDFGVIVSHPSDTRPKQSRAKPLFKVNHTVKLTKLLESFKNYQNSSEFTVNGLRFDAWKLLHLNLRMRDLGHLAGWTLHDLNEGESSEHDIRKEDVNPSEMPLYVLCVAV